MFAILNLLKANALYIAFSIFNKGTKHKEEKKMNAVFRDLRWKKGTARIYPDANGYGGSYITTTPAMLYITLLTDDDRIIIKDIADTVRYANNWKNFSEKRFSNLKAKLERIYQFQVDDNGDILDLEEAVIV